MGNLAIHLSGVGKQYQVGRRPSQYSTIRESITSAAASAARALTGRRDTYGEPVEFWALRDVSFEVKHGEIVGLIGRNGAGKSTLLKVLSRITAPTTGRIELYGRLGSLLEVGTGFHPELTGRENIFLNGAILGMTKVEIERRFDEIVAFADIGGFLDTPVKRYSSGMQMKLGFSVAAHLEPEILLVDEVLAVGDVAFQRKCLQKMREVATAGQTVLLVSHNMAAVMNLCSRGIVLHGGTVVKDAPAGEAVAKYIALGEEVSQVPLGERVDRKGNQKVRFTKFDLLDERGNPLAQALSGQDVQLAFEVEIRASGPLTDMQVDIGIHGNYDQPLFHLSTRTTAARPEFSGRTRVLRCHVPRLPLQPGSYTFNLYCSINNEVADWVQAAGGVEVASGDFFGSGRLPPGGQGPFLVSHEWSASDRRPTEVTV